jgi:hypothetical protein
MVCWIFYPEKANSGPYLNSAHGSSSNGVNRTATKDLGYSKGNCAHCHEQHASIGGSEPNPTGGPSKFCLLADNFSGVTSKPYSQSDSVCFYCHFGSGTFQSPAFYNYSYSITFGGNPDITPNNIFDAFNSTSYHNLNDVLNFAKNKWSSTFTADSNPCSACHNVHIAKRSCGKPNGSYDSTLSAISKPSDHGNLWGDEASERMMAGVGADTYRAPFYVGANPALPATSHEPDGQSRTIDSDEVKGSTTPDYNTFCLDCHHEAIGAIGAIPWNPGDVNFDRLAMHGKKDATNSWGWAVSQRPPYTLDGTSGTAEDLTKNFVLSCLDCHEPHGSQTPNGEYLLRTTVNGVSGITYAGAGQYYYLCYACHDNIIGPHFGANIATNCRGCHRHVGPLEALTYF